MSSVWCCSHSCQQPSQMLAWIRSPRSVRNGGLASGVASSPHREQWIVSELMSSFRQVRLGPEGGPAGRRRGGSTPAVPAQATSGPPQPDPDQRRSLAAHGVCGHRLLRAGPGGDERRPHPSDGYLGGVDRRADGDPGASLGARGNERRGDGAPSQRDGARGSRPGRVRGRRDRPRHPEPGPLLPGNGRVPAEGARPRGDSGPRHPGPVLGLRLRAVGGGRVDPVRPVPDRPPGRSRDPVHGDRRDDAGPRHRGPLRGWRRGGRPDGHRGGGSGRALHPHPFRRPVGGGPVGRDRLLEEAPAHLGRGHRGGPPLSDDAGS